jgi:hypothetical protein
MLKFIRDLQVPGLHVGGDGAGPVAVAPFLGCHLEPDITILSFSRRLLAIEVKILRPSSFSSDVTKAVGQASLYRTFGFHKSAILLVDRERVVRTSEIQLARRRLDSIGIALIVRQNVAGKLSIDQTYPYGAVTSSS